MILTDILLLILDLLVLLSFLLALGVVIVSGIMGYCNRQAYAQAYADENEQQGERVVEDIKPCGFGSNWRTVKNSGYEEDEDDEEDEEDEPDEYVDEVYCNDNSRRGKRVKRGSKTAISNN